MTQGAPECVSSYSSMVFDVFFLSGGWMFEPLTNVTVAVLMHYHGTNELFCWLQV